MILLGICSSMRTHTRQEHKRKWWDQQIKERDWTMQLMMALLDPTLSCAQV
jgi:hypothetical protein